MVSLLLLNRPNQKIILGWEGGSFGSSTPTLTLPPEGKRKAPSPSSGKVGMGAAQGISIVASTLVELVETLLATGFDKLNQRTNFIRFEIPWGVADSGLHMIRVSLGRQENCPPRLGLEAGF